MDEIEQLSRWRTALAVFVGAGLTAIGVAGGVSQADPAPVESSAVVICLRSMVDPTADPC